MIKLMERLRLFPLSSSASQAEQFIWESITAMTVDRSTTGGLVDRLASRIQLRTAKVCVVGLGYVGLPLAETFAWGGYSVLGFDVDPEKIRKLQEGQSYIGHIPSRRIAEMAATGSFEATSEPDRFAVTRHHPRAPLGLRAVESRLPQLGRHRPQIQVVVARVDASSRIHVDLLSTVPDGYLGSAPPGGRRSCRNWFAGGPAVEALDRAWGARWRPGSESMF